MRNLPIGVFDSGVGGLTVLRALRAVLPDEDIVYLGDTARLPYGTKSGDTIKRYAVQAADCLVKRGIKLLVIACNTASAYALDAVQLAHPEIPVIGVVLAGAQAAVAASVTGRIGVLATEGTISSGTYRKAIHAIKPEAVVMGQPCTLMVGLAEEGWTDGIEAESIIRRYLTPILAEQPDCLVLGCTHFPLLQPIVQQVAGEGVHIVDSAATTAAAVAQLIVQHNLSTQGAARLGNVQLLATDGAARFARVASHFLQESITPSQIEIVDL